MDIEPSGQGLGSQVLADRLQQRVQRYGLAIEHQLPRIELGQIDQFGDQPVQLVARLTQGGQIALLLRRQIRLSQEIGHALYPAERRAQGVAHPGQHRVKVDGRRYCGG